MQPKVIKTYKKYANRKLYDCQESRYTTALGLAEDIRRGVEVRVVDYRNGKDVTRAVLLECAFNMAKSYPSDTAESLHNIIKYGGRLNVQRPGQ